MQDEDQRGVVGIKLDEAIKRYREFPKCGCVTCNQARAIVLMSTQPAPQQNTAPAVWDLVLNDIAQRDSMGAEKYGQRLTPGDGRDSLIDAYQEALDLVVYLRKAIYERDSQGACPANATSEK